MHEDEPHVPLGPFDQDLVRDQNMHRAGRLVL